RKFVSKGKYVDDSSPDGKLSGFINKVNPVKIMFRKQFHQEIEVEIFAFPDPKTVFVKGALCDYPLANGLRVAYYQVFFCGVAQTGKDFRPLKHIGIVQAVLAEIFLEGRRK